MNQIQISFYDEIISVNCPSTLTLLKRSIAQKFYLDPIDVEELIMYYINENDRVSISNEADFQQAIFNMNKELSSDKNYLFTVYLQVSEKSKLYQREFESSRVDFKNSCEIDVEKKRLEEEETQRRENERLTQQEALRKEILEREKLLKEILEREKEEIMRREREVAEKEREKEREEMERLMREKLIKEKLDKVRMEQVRLEREGLEQEKLAAEKLEKEKVNIRESISKAVNESVNNNIEKIREELIRKTIEETNKALENSLTLNSSKIPVDSNKTVHRAVSCNLCGVGPIVGNRYKCTECYDYDLCENCENKKEHSQEHPVIKYKSELNFSFGGRFPKYHFKNPFRGFNHCHQNKDGENKKFFHKLKKMKFTYGLDDITDEQILAALNKTDGNVEEAIALLF